MTGIGKLPMLIKTVLGPDQNGWVSRRQENSDCRSPDKPLWGLLAASGATQYALMVLAE